MIIVACTQGSPEWHRARAGVITASVFRVARERLKSGDFSAAGKKLAFRLAIERISGAPLDDGFETWAMRRGHELESAARMEHEIQTGQVVQRAGFVHTEDRLFGASADGLIGDDGGAEYKCLVSPESLMPVLLDGDISDYIDQIQGCIWLTGRSWWDYCLYCPALDSIGRQLTRIRVIRNDDYIEKMELDLLKFSELVFEYESTLRRGIPPDERG